MKIKIEYKDCKKTLRISRMIKKVIKKALQMYGVGYESYVYVQICKDEYIKEINAKHRKIDKATDVLSFPLIDWDRPCDWDSLKMGEDINLVTGEIQLGDILVSLDTSISQAKEYEHSLEREISYLSLHGLLHLLGYDHMTDEEKAIMRNQEEKVLKAMNIVR